MKETLIKWGIYLLLISAILTLSFKLGVSHEKDRQNQLQIKANAQVVKKNENVQTVADKAEIKQIEYRDRIVYKYKTIKEEVIKYEATKDANDNLDAEFVRLHNSAATNGEVQTARTSSGTESTDAGFEVTKGQAIGVITDNYEQYYHCQRIVKGWQDYYRDLQKEISK